MIETINKAILPKIVEIVIQTIGKRLKLSSPGFDEVRTERSRRAISDHLEMLHTWASDISFKGLVRSKRMQESYVDLDVHPGFVWAGSSDREDQTLHVSDICRINGHTVLVGDPGAGKTTSLKRVVLYLLSRYNIDTAGYVPILVRLGGFSESDALPRVVLRTLGIDVQFTQISAGFIRDKEGHKLKAWRDLEEDERRAIERQVATHYLQTVRAVLLVDGLDELHPKARDGVVSELRHFMLHLTNAKVMLTSRTGEFRYHFENTRTLTLRPLTEPQVRHFAAKWLGEDRAIDFVDRIRGNPYAGSEVRPLTLAHLCAIYERSGTIPEKPKTIYRKIVRLLLEEWDEQRSVRRYSRYKDFEVDQKEEFLEAIAYHLRQKYDRSIFSHIELKRAYAMINAKFGLPASEVTRVVREIESHTGLLIQVSEDEYEFTHKSIHEYLTASYILKLPNIPAHTVPGLPNEAALVLALSADPNHYFVEVAASFTSKSLPRDPDFAEAFIRRLQIERVDFVPSTRLGSAVLALYTETFYPPIEVPRMQRNNSKKSFLSFVKSPPIVASIYDVLRNSAIHRMENGLYSVKPGPWPKLLKVGIAQNRRTGVVITIDQELIDIIVDNYELLIRDS